MYLPDKFKGARGAASLPTVIALAFLILTVGVSILAVSAGESLVAAASVESDRALFYAESGARDALQRITRNKKFFVIGDYQLEFVENGCTNNEGCAIISVDDNIDPKTIIAEGRVKNLIRRVRLQVYFDSQKHGEIVQLNWSELSD